MQEVEPVRWKVDAVGQEGSIAGPSMSPRYCCKILRDPREF